MEATVYNCPKCGKELAEEREIDEYPFVCLECDENFYMFEVVESGIVPRPDNAHCPVCGSEDCDGGPVEIEFNRAYQPCRCAECGSEWNDVYQFRGCVDIWKEQLDLRDE